MPWCSERSVWQQDSKEGTQGIAQSQMMQRGGHVESWGEPVKLLISKFNTVYIEGLVISVVEVKVYNQLRKKKKVLRSVEESPLVAVTDKRLDAASGSESPQAFIGSGEVMCTRREFSCTPAAAYLCLPSQESWARVTLGDWVSCCC